MKHQWIIGFFVLTMACAPTRYVRTLDEKQNAIGLSLGGPVIEFSGSKIPMPISTLSYGYGLKDNLTLFGSIHPTSLAFHNLQTDFGALYKFREQSGYIPYVSGTLAGNLVIDLNDPVVRFWPEADVNFSWTYGKGNNFFYTGCSNWFELRKTRSSDQPQIGRWLFNPHVGHTFKHKSMQYNLELKLLAPFRSNQNVFIPWKSLTGSTGATGIYFSIIKTF